MPDHAQHFALVRQVEAEAGHIPPAAWEAWQEAGPRRVRRALADRLRALAAAGALAVEDADGSALQLAVLLQAARHPGTGSEPRTAMRAAIRTFLYGHVPRR